MNPHLPKTTPPEVRSAVIERASALAWALGTERAYHDGEPTDEVPRMKAGNSPVSG